MILNFLLAFQMFSPTDPATLRPLYEKAIAIRSTKYGEKSAEAAAAMGDYGRFLARSQDPAAAVQWLSRAIVISARLEDKQALAMALESIDPLQAAALHEEVGTKAKGELAAVSWSRLGAMREAQRSFTQSEKVYRAAIASSTNDEKLSIRLNELALLLKGQGNLRDAEPLLRRAVKIQQQVLGAGNPELGATLNNLSGLLLDTNRSAEAELLARRALQIFEGTLGRGHVRTAIAASNLADVLLAQGVKVQAVKYYQQALAVFEKELGPDHAWTRDVRDALAHSFGKD